MLAAGQTVLVSVARGALIEVMVRGRDPRGFWVGRQLRGLAKGGTRLFSRKQVVAMRTPEGFRMVLAE